MDRFLAKENCLQEHLARLRALADRIGREERNLGKSGRLKNGIFVEKEEEAGAILAEEVRV